MTEALAAEFRLALSVMERRLIHASGMARLRDEHLYAALEDAISALGWLYQLTWVLDNSAKDEIE